MKTFRFSWVLWIFCLLCDVFIRVYVFWFGGVFLGNNDQTVRHTDHSDSDAAASLQPHRKLCFSDSMWGGERRSSRSWHSCSVLWSLGFYSPFTGHNVRVPELALVWKLAFEFVKERNLYVWHVLQCCDVLDKSCFVVSKVKKRTFPCLSQHITALWPLKHNTWHLFEL